MDSSATVDIVQKIACALNLKVFSIHIYRGHSIDHPLRDDWIQLVNPFYHLAPEEAAVKADLENCNG